MGIALDIIFAVLLVWSVCSGFKHGFIHALVAFIGTVLAFIASGMLSGLAADLLCKLIAQARVPTSQEYYVIRCVATVLLFIGLICLVQLLARALDMVFKLPVLKSVNGILGGAFGLFRGAVIMVLLCAALSLAAPMAEQSGNNLLMEAMQGSRLYSFSADKTPNRLFGLAAPEKA